MGYVQGQLLGYERFVVIFVRMKLWMDRSYREVMEFRKFRVNFRGMKIKELEIPIYTGDFVQVMKGPDAGKTGKVLAVYRSLNWIYVRALNMKTEKHTDTDGKEVYFRVERPYLPDELQLLDPSNKNKPTKVSIVSTTSGNKFRLTEAGNAMFIPRDGDPELVGPYAHIPSYRDGPYDTSPQETLKKTYRHSLNTVEEDLLAQHREYIQRKLSEGLTGRQNTMPRIPKKKYISQAYIPSYLEVVQLEQKPEPTKKVKVKLSNSA